MPAIPTVEGAWRVRANWRSANGQHSSSIVTYFRSQAGWQPAAALVARLNARFTPDMLRGMVVPTTFAGFDCFDMEAGTATLRLDGNWAPAVVLGGQHTPQLALPIKCRPLERGRPASVFHIAHMRSVIQQSGRIVEAHRVLIEAAWRTFLANMAVDGWDWGRPTGPPNGWQTFATVECRREIASVNRRMAEVYRGRVKAD